MGEVLKEILQNGLSLNCAKVWVESISVGNFGVFGDFKFWRVRVSERVSDCDVEEDDVPGGKLISKQILGVVKFLFRLFRCILFINSYSLWLVSALKSYSS